MKHYQLIVALFLVAAAACGRPEFGTTTGDEKVVDTDVDREAPNDRDGQGSVPVVGDDASGNNDYAQEEPTDPLQPDHGSATGGSDFAFQAYRALAMDGRNAVLAPHGLARSLVIAHAAADGEEAAAVAAVLEPYLGGDIYSRFNSSDLDYESREAPQSFQMTGGVWIDETVAIESDFAETLARYVGPQVRLLDFAAAPADARNTINNWHSTESNGRISEVVGPRSVEPSTRFLITDATWFSASWGFGGFDPDQTEYRAFSGTETDVQLPMMATQQTLSHVAGTDFDAVILPFLGGFSLLAVLPGNLDAFEQQASPQFLDRLAAEATPTEVALEFPRIEVSDRVALSRVADSVGLGLLFDDDARYVAFADGTQLDDAHQRTRISFNEEGVDVAANVGDDSAQDPSPPDQSMQINLTFDRPFFFAIRDVESGSYLFIGRVAQP